MRLLQVIGFLLLVNVSYCQNYMSIDSLFISTKIVENASAYPLFSDNTYYFIPYNSNKLIKYIPGLSGAVDSLILEIDEKSNIEIGCVKISESGYQSITNNFKDIHSFDSKGKLIKKRRINLKYKGITYNLHYFNSYTMSWPHDYTSGSFLIKCSESGLAHKKGDVYVQSYLSRKGLIAKVDTMGKIVNVFGTYPSNFKNMKGASYVQGYFFNRDQNDNAFVGFEADPMVKIYNKNGVEIDSFGEPGKHITYRNPDIPFRDKFDIKTYIFHFRIENPEYYNIIPLGNNYVVRFYTNGIKDFSGFNEEYAEKKRAFYTSNIDGCRIPTKIDDEQIRIYYQEKKFYYQLYQKTGEKYKLLEDEPLNLSDVIVLGVTEDKVVFRTTESRMDKYFKIYQLVLNPK